MASTNQPVRFCVLKVNLKSCSGCPNKAKTKLQNLPGVSAVEYNVVKGLMTVTGDVDPMTLVQKLARCNKKAELVSVNYMSDDDLISHDEEDKDEDEDEEDTSSDDTSSTPDPTPMERVSQVNTRPIIKKKEGILRKYLLLGCLRRKPKVVQPFPLAKRMFGSTRFENGTFDHGGGYGNARRPPPQFHGSMIPHQQYHMMMQQGQPPPQVQFQMSGAPMHMIQQQQGPLPYFIEMEPQNKAAVMSMFPQPPKPNPKMLVNNAIHYSGK